MRLLIAIRVDVKPAEGWRPRVGTMPEKEKLMKVAAVDNVLVGLMQAEANGFPRPEITMHVDSVYCVHDPGIVADVRRGRQGEHR